MFKEILTENSHRVITIAHLEHFVLRLAKKSNTAIFLNQGQITPAVLV